MANNEEFRQQVIQALDELLIELASVQKTLADIEKDSTNGTTSLGTNNQK